MIEPSKHILGILFSEASKLDKQVDVDTIQYLMNQILSIKHTDLKVEDNSLLSKLKDESFNPPIIKDGMSVKKSYEDIFRDLNSQFNKSLEQFQEIKSLEETTNLQTKKEALSPEKKAQPQDNISTHSVTKVQEQPSSPECKIFRRENPGSTFIEQSGSSKIEIPNFLKDLQAGNIGFSYHHPEDKKKHFISFSTTEIKEDKPSKIKLQKEDGTVEEIDHDMVYIPEDIFNILININYTEIKVGEEEEKEEKLKAMFKKFLEYPTNEINELVNEKNKTDDGKKILFLLCFLNLKKDNFIEKTKQEKEKKLQEQAAEQDTKAKEKTAIDLENQTHRLNPNKSIPSSDPSKEISH